MAQLKPDSNGINVLAEAYSELAGETELTDMHYGRADEKSKRLQEYIFTVDDKEATAAGGQKCPHPV